VLVVQNDVGNHYGPTVIISALTSQIEKARLPIHVTIPAGRCGMERQSIVLLEQLRTVDKRRLRHRIGRLTAWAWNDATSDGGPAGPPSTSYHPPRHPLPTAGGRRR